MKLPGIDLLVKIDRRGGHLLKWSAAVLLAFALGWAIGYEVGRYVWRDAATVEAVRNAFR